MVTLPETDSSHLKMDDWKTSLFPFGFRQLFSGTFVVSFREGNNLYDQYSLPPDGPFQGFQFQKGNHFLKVYFCAPNLLVNFGANLLIGKPPKP